jgi:UDP-glucose 4-epimerase
MTKVAVTGANGFMGGYLVEALLGRGHDVLCLGRSAESLASVEGDVERHVTDYGVEDLTAALAGCDALVHLAGRRSVRGEDMELVGEFAQVGLSMLDGLLRGALANGLKQVVQASSIAVYSGANRRPYSEDETPVPASNYGLAKYFCEQYADWWSRRHGIPVAHLRIAACYGAGEKLTPALMKMSDRAWRGQYLKVSDGGRHGIDQIYVRDVAGAILRVLETGGSGPYNIGAGRAASVLEIAETANAVFGNDGNLEVGPVEANSSPPAHNCMATGRAAEKLGWTPAYSLRDGLAEMRDIWNRSTKRVDQP